MIDKKELGILIEPARKYIESYPARVQEFIFEFEGYETDFIKRDLSFFQSVKEHLKDPRARDYPFFEADEALKYLGEEKMNNFLRRKIEFLVEKQKSLASDSPSTVINSLPPQILTSSESKRQKLLGIHFFDLELVEALTSEQQEKLIELLFSNKTPYQVALLDYLGLFDFLQRRMVVKTEIFKKLSDVLKINARTVKGNFYVLGENTYENTARYTSLLFKEVVEKDYKIISQK